MDAWWIETSATVETDPKRRAVAYYRHSAEIGQENSVEIQQDNVRAFAKKHDLEIIHEFADRGKSGLTAEGRPAFIEIMHWVQTRNDFRLVLVLNISSLGPVPGHGPVGPLRVAMHPEGQAGHLHQDPHLVTVSRSILFGTGIA